VPLGAARHNHHPFCVGPAEQSIVDPMNQCGGAMSWRVINVAMSVVGLIHPEQKGSLHRVQKLRLEYQYREDPTPRRVDRVLATQRLGQPKADVIQR